MTTKRVFLVFLFFAAAANALILRLWWLMTDADYAEAAAAQQSYVLTVARQRPDFYDRNGEPLTGTGARTLALLFPGKTASWNALPFLDEAGKAQLEAGMEGEMPFLLELSGEPPAYALPQTLTVRARTDAESLATHLIGYIGADGGVTGLERALDEYLAANAASVKVRLTVNALGDVVAGSEPQILREGGEGQGVVLTLDAGVQRICEEACDSLMERGAVIVLDVETGGILAWVSRPDFDRGDVAAALSRTDGALLDRADLAWPAGSVYKPVIAAAALEAGVSPAWRYTCTGAIEAGGVTYGCNDRTAHGEQDMEQALANSCNCYFIALGQRSGADNAAAMGRALGFGSGAALCAGFGAAAGNLPTSAQLADAGELCNHCFGQGKLLVTPLQVAGLVRAVARGGVWGAPSLILNIGGQPAEEAEERRAMSAETAALLCSFMQTVVAEGTGRHGAPAAVSAAAKTGTAQTGRFDESEKETLIGWYAGFFPADAPRYAVAVMMEGVTYGSASAGPVFKAIADALYPAEEEPAPVEAAAQPEGGAEGEQPASGAQEKAAENAGQGQDESQAEGQDEALQQSGADAPSG